jgi:glucose 1-dehydrogenase
MEALGKNGVLVLSSVTGGETKSTVPADRINLGFVLGNKVAVGSVSANRKHFIAGVRDLAYAEGVYPGWLRRLLPIRSKALRIIAGCSSSWSKRKRRSRSTARWRTFNALPAD